MVNLEWNMTQKLDPRLEPSNYKQLPRSFAHTHVPHVCPSRALPLFYIACLTEQPSNKLRLHTLCHEVTVTGIVSWYHLRAVLRVCTSRLYGQVKVIDYERLLPGCGELTHMTHSTFPPAFVYLFPARQNKDILNYLLHTARCSA